MHSHSAGRSGKIPRTGLSILELKAKAEAKDLSHIALRLIALLDAPFSTLQDALLQFQAILKSP